MARGDAKCDTLTDGRCDSSHRSGPWDISSHCGRLGRSRRLRSSRLLLHLSVTLT